MIRHKFDGWRSLGGVLLAFTGECPRSPDLLFALANPLLEGVEALFADLGAFSVKQVSPGRWRG